MKFVADEDEYERWQILTRENRCAWKKSVQAPLGNDAY
jgi:hypothetical protein